MHNSLRLKRCWRFSSFSVVSVTIECCLHRQGQSHLAQTAAACGEQIPARLLSQGVIPVAAMPLAMTDTCTPKDLEQVLCTMAVAGTGPFMATEGTIALSACCPCCSSSSCQGASSCQPGVPAANDPLGHWGGSWKPGATGILWGCREPTLRCDPMPPRRLFVMLWNFTEP